MLLLFQKSKRILFSTEDVERSMHRDTFDKRVYKRDEIFSQLYERPYRPVCWNTGFGCGQPGLAATDQRSQTEPELSFFKVPL